MDEDPPGEWTRLLHAAGEGDGEALGALLPLVYERLRGVAEARLRRERPGHTLNPTGLVHEAWLKLRGPGGLRARDRAHFLALASRAMGQVLVDHARARNAERRGGGRGAVTLHEELARGETDLDDLLDLAQALEDLDPRQRQVVECRFFGGMEEGEIASALGITARTVRRDWVKARAWLYQRLYPDGEGP